MTAIQPVSTNGTLGAAVSSAGAGGEMGKQEFLELLVTQLKHQDPLNPMDATQFASQLAEFSGLEQLLQVKEAVAAQSESTAMMALSVNTNLAASLLGHTVLAPGNQIEVTNAGTANISVDVGAPGGAATVRISNGNGQVLREVEVGTVAAGRQNLTLDDLSLPPGAYVYEMSVRGANDAEIPVTNYVGGEVSGIQFQDGTLMLRVGELLVPMSYLVEIAAGSEAGTSGD